MDEELEVTMRSFLDLAWQCVEIDTELPDRIYIPMMQAIDLLTRVETNYREYKNAGSNM